MFPLAFHCCLCDRLVRPHFMQQHMEVRQAASVRLHYEEVAQSRPPFLANTL